MYYDIKYIVCVAYNDINCTKNIDGNILECYNFIVIYQCVKLKWGLQFYVLKVI